MRRHLLRITVALMLGALSALAIAWGLAAWRTIPTYPRDRLGAFECWERAWSYTEVRRFGIVDRWWLDLSNGTQTAKSTPRDLLAYLAQAPAPVSALLAQSRANREQRYSKQPGLLIDDAAPLRGWGSFTLTEEPTAGKDKGCDVAFGWPRPMLWYRIVARIYLIGPNVSTVDQELEGGIHLRGAPISTRLRDFHILPLWPIWRGVILNVLFFAALWWMILAAPAALRRYWRRRRSACIDCGYDLRGLVESGCPECGRGRGQIDRGTQKLPPTVS
jgi:hypothetical protein